MAPAPHQTIAVAMGTSLAHNAKRTFLLRATERMAPVRALVMELVLLNPVPPLAHVHVPRVGVVWIAKSQHALVLQPIMPRFVVGKESVRDPTFAIAQRDSRDSLALQSLRQQELQLLTW